MKPKESFFNKKFLSLFFVCLLAALSMFAQTGHRHFLLRDEGLSQLSYIDLSDSTKNWYQPIPTGRDIQLIGNNRVLIGTDNGYEERDIATGKKMYELASFPGTISARRLSNGNTILVGLNWQGKEGIVLVEVNPNASVQRLIVYPGFKYARLVRETVSGTFLVTANDVAFEGDLSGNVLWKAKITSNRDPHCWQALRLLNGETVVSSGYAGNIQVFAKDGSLLRTITGPDAVKPNFYAGLQLLPNGNYVVINWEGHGKTHGDTGTQLLEYTPDGKLVWKWQQSSAHFSSLHAVIMLDGLDTRQLHIEDANGVLKPVKPVKFGLE
jgi:hypothetical protein